jgi:hypothetical protein
MAWACVAVSSVSASTITYGNQVANYDPVFGLPYNGRLVHFATINIQKVAPSCVPILKSEEGSKASTIRMVFAEYTSPSAIFLVVSPPLITHLEADASILLAAESNRCLANSPKLALTQYRFRDLPPGRVELADDQVLGLLENAFIRYSKAFGSKKIFLDWLDGQSLNLVKGVSATGRSSNFPPAYPFDFTRLEMAALKAFRNGS